MSLSRQMRCLATPSNLGALLAFVDESCVQAGLDEEARFAVRLAGEEALSNVIDHAYQGREPGPVTLDVQCGASQVVLVVEDRAPYFDPADAPPPDLESDLAQRRIGGLGWHLIRQFMDEVRHAPAEGGGNRLELVKHLRVPTQIDK